MIATSPPPNASEAWASWPWEERITSIVSKIGEEGKALLANFQKQNVEEIRTFPTLQKHDFHRDSTDWKEAVSSSGEKIRANKEIQPDIREYGPHQFFTHKSLLRSIAEEGDILPASSSIYVDLIEQKYAGNYQDFLIGEEIQFPWWHFAGSKEIHGIGRHIWFLCADGSIFFCYKKGRHSYHCEDFKNYAFSARCRVK
jgi:hypothetical protein